MHILSESEARNVMAPPLCIYPKSKSKLTASSLYRCFAHLLLIRVATSHQLPNLAEILSDV